MNELTPPWIATASRKKRWLLGVSGGLDSMALLHILNESGFSNLVVCHLNHQLRGKSSDGDERFVRRVSEKMGYLVETKRVDLKVVAGETRESLETSGRNVRHEFFSECARKHRCKHLLLAHHADDQAETVLWNLMRGSAMCRGMQDVKEIKMGKRLIQVERPLLETRKSELANWMREKKFSWREDASNSVNDVVRNRLRNEALPLLSEIAKRDVAPRFSRAAMATDSWMEMMDWAAEKAAVRDPQGRLHLGVLKNLPEFLKQYVLVDLLKSLEIGNLSTALLERCAEILDPDGPPSVNLPGGGRLRRRQGRIFVEAS